MKDQTKQLELWEKIERFAIWIAYATLVALIVTFIVLACSNIAHASPLDCEGISNADQRHFCRALSKPQKSECEFIKDPDLRHQCRARVK
jgi:hypothetical protein